MRLKYTDGFDDIKHLPFEEKVIEVLGKNHTNPIQFEDAKSYDDPYGLYTYRGGIYVLKGGMDLDYKDLSDQDKKNLNQWFDSENWEVNKSLQ